MDLKCDFCKEPADWRREPTKELSYAALRCNLHVPDWRLSDFVPLTLIARERQAAHGDARLPKPAETPTQEPPTPTTPAPTTMKARVTRPKRAAKGGR